MSSQGKTVITAELRGKLSPSMERIFRIVMDDKDTPPMVFAGVLYDIGNRGKLLHKELFTINSSEDLQKKIISPALELYRSV